MKIDWVCECADTCAGCYNTTCGYEVILATMMILSVCIIGFILIRRKTKLEDLKKNGE